MPDDQFQRCRTAVQGYREAGATTTDAFNALRDYWITHGGKLTPKQARAGTEAIAALWRAVEAERRAVMGIAQAQWEVLKSQAEG